MSYLEFLCGVEAEMTFPGSTDSAGGKERRKKLYLYTVRELGFYFRAQGEYDVDRI
jgi:hypothetical protein